MLPLPPPARCYNPDPRRESDTDARLVARKVQSLVVNDLNGLDGLQLDVDTRG